MKPSVGDTVSVWSFWGHVHGRVVELDSYGAWVTYCDDALGPTKRHFIWSQMRILGVVDLLSELGR